MVELSGCYWEFIVLLSYFFGKKTEIIWKRLDKISGVCYNELGYHICLRIGSNVSTLLP